MVLHTGYWNSKRGFPEGKDGPVDCLGVEFLKPNIGSGN